MRAHAASSPECPHQVRLSILASHSASSFFKTFKGDCNYTCCARSLKPATSRCTCSRHCSRNITQKEQRLDVKAVSTCTDCLQLVSGVLHSGLPPL